MSAEVIGVNILAGNLTQGMCRHALYFSPQLGCFMTAVVYSEPAALQSALLDPVFLACLCSAAGNPELVAGFRNLAGHQFAPHDMAAGTGADDASASLAGDFMRFVNFVHGTIYMRLDPKVRQDMGAALALARRACEGLLLN
ncbi:hypothetical protein [Azohydromonas lata]|uniref:hypothetical protein n=1 Tax=Azohydromonas lata TaxID=45677 RepID=UPI0012F4E5EA|nr:hypothetical protein [Azohydromonas lata]